MKIRIILIIVGILLLIIGFITFVEVKSVRNFSLMVKTDENSIKTATGSASIRETVLYWDELPAVEELFTDISTSSSSAN